MNSETAPRFWDAYRNLSPQQKKAAQKSYRQWKADPFHPSLHFKCVNRRENIWSVRISRGTRALCIIEDDTAIWFWIGDHDVYDRLIG